MDTPQYGTPLRERTAYASLFQKIEAQLQSNASQKLTVEHVGGTSLDQPAGKGDVDVYVLYTDAIPLPNLIDHVATLFGQPAKVTQNRARFNLVFDGIEAEIQLVNAETMQASIALRDYLNKYPEERTRYAEHIAEMRQAFLKEMSEFKAGYAKRALEDQILGD